MQNKSFNLEFSERLRELMVQRGHTSRNSSSGVSPSALCKAVDCFPEMALRYLDGRSIPNPQCILKISEWLKVEPGYLLFGEHGYKKAPGKNIIKISKDLLEYILIKIIPLLKENKEEDDILDFFLSIILDLSQLQVESDQLKKVFDLTIKSSVFCKKDSTFGNTKHGRCGSKESTSKIAS